MSGRTGRSVAFALAAAALYALSTPFSKVLLADISPNMMAALLYLGAGAGMTALSLASGARGDAGEVRGRPLERADAPYVAAMVALDIAAPLLLMAGLSLSSAESVSLLNNFEIVATALIARLAFGERVGARTATGIGVISMHLNMDSAPEGIDWHLMKGLGGTQEDGVLNGLSSGGYGRIYDIKPVTFKEFVKRTQRTFETKRCFAYGDDDRIIKRVASFCGAGCSEDAAGMAINGGADVLVSSDIAHHMITGLFYSGVNVLQLTHYCSEVYGFKLIAKKLSPSFGVPVCVYVDPQLM